MYKLLFLSGFLFCTVNLFSNPSYELDKPGLELSFKLTEDGKRIDDYYVLIYCDTNTADTLFITKGKVAYLNLEYNHNYTLRYVKPGYRDRILIVKTDVASSKHPKYMEFDFEIELIKENDSPNTFYDLPVAVIQFDKENKKFEYSRKYHRQVRGKVIRETEEK